MFSKALLQAPKYIILLLFKLFFEKYSCFIKFVYCYSSAKSDVASFRIQQTYTYIPLRKGTEIEISNINAISDKQKAGTNIVFVSDKPVRTPYYTIPQGTKFVGKIVESHNPQITGNGGLVSIEVVTIILANQYQHIDTRITKINDKRIFFEDIKHPSVSITSIISLKSS